MNNLQLLFYLSALCGEGKTKNVCNHIINSLISNTALLKCKIYMYAAPTDALTSSVYELLLNDAPKQLKSHIIKITHDPKGDRVVNRIINEIKIANESNKTIVLCITHKGLEFLSKINRTDILKNTILFGDEIMENMIDIKSLCIPNNTHLITNHIEIDTDSKFKTNGEVVQVKLKNIEAAKRFIVGSMDKADKIVKPLIENLACGNYDVFVLKATWDKIIVNRDISNDTIRSEKEKGTDKNHIIFISLANPNIFKPFESVTFMAAHFERSLQYIWWTRLYTELTGKPAFELKKSPLGDGLNDEIHLNGHRIKSIQYFQNNDYSIASSAKLVDEDDVNSPTIYDAMLDACLAEICRNPHVNGIVAYNKNMRIINHENMTTASIKSHGQNNYMDKNAAYILTSLNLPPRYYYILKALGFTQYEISVAVKYEFYYQFVMRTALRDNYSDEDIDIILMDKNSAIYVYEQFKGAPLPKIMNDGIINNLFDVKAYQSDYYNQEKQVEKRKISDKMKYINKQIDKLKAITDIDPNDKKINKLKQSIEKHKGLYSEWITIFEKTYNEQYT